MASNGARQAPSQALADECAAILSHNRANPKAQLAILDACLASSPIHHGGAENQRHQASPKSHSDDNAPPSAHGDRANMGVEEYSAMEDTNSNNATSAHPSSRHSSSATTSLTSSSPSKSSVTDSASSTLPQNSSETPTHGNSGTGNAGADNSGTGNAGAGNAGAGNAGAGSDTPTPPEKESDIQDSLASNGQNISSSSDQGSRFRPSRERLSSRPTFGKKPNRDQDKPDQDDASREPPAGNNPNKDNAPQPPADPAAPPNTPPPPGADGPGVSTGSPGASSSSFSSSPSGASSTVGSGASSSLSSVTTTTAPSSEPPSTSLSTSLSTTTSPNVPVSTPGAGASSSTLLTSSSASSASSSAVPPDSTSSLLPPKPPEAVPPGQDAPLPQPPQPEPPKQPPQSTQAPPPAPGTTQQPPPPAPETTQQPPPPPETTQQPPPPAAAEPPQQLPAPSPAPPPPETTQQPPQPPPVESPPPPPPQQQQQPQRQTQPNRQTEPTSASLPTQTPTLASPPTVSSSNVAQAPQRGTGNDGPGQGAPGSQPAQPAQSAVPPEAAPIFLEPPQSTPAPRLGQDDNDVAPGSGSAPQNPAIPISNSKVNKGLAPAKTTLDTSASTTLSTAREAVSDKSSQASAPRPTNSNSIGGLLGANRPERPIPSRPQNNGPTNNPTRTPDSTGSLDDVPGRNGDNGGNGNDIAELRPVADASSRSTRALSTGGIIGVSIGSFAAVSLIIVLILLWRKKSAQRRGNRMLSPFSRGTDRDRDAATDSMGPMADTAAPGGESHRFAPFFNFNRGRAVPHTAAANAPRASVNNQFLEASQASRLERGATAPRPGSAGLTVKDRVVDWWSRRAEDKDFGERVRDGRGGPSTAPEMANAGLDSRPDFLPGLHFGADGSETWDPFSDGFATAESAPYRTQAAAQVENPFADPHVVPAPLQMHKPNQYDAAETSPWVRRAPSTASREPGRSVGSSSPVFLRESVQSDDSFIDRRDKFRSDPFDLELESRMIPDATAIAEMPRHVGGSSVQHNHLRYASMTSSRYTSGVTVSEWEDTAPYELPSTSSKYGSGPTVGQAI